MSIIIIIITRSWVIPRFGSKIYDIALLFLFGITFPVKLKKKNNYLKLIFIYIFIILIFNNFFKIKIIILIYLLNKKYFKKYS